MFGLSTRSDVWRRVCAPAFNNAWAAVMSPVPNKLFVYLAH
jgi:hypothetical protein